MPPYDSAALHFVKTGETGGSPGQRITGPSSGNALYSPVRLAPRWPPLRPGHALAPNVSLASGRQANSSLLPSLLSLPAQKPEQRGPRDPNNARQTASLSSARTDSGWTSTAGPAEAGRLALWRMSVAPLAVRVPRWALRLALLPFKPRPCATHSRPEVRRRGPRDPIRPPPDCEPSAQPGLTRAGPARRVPLRLADWRLEGSARLLQKPAGRRHTPPRILQEHNPRAPAWTSLRSGLS